MRRVKSVHTRSRGAGHYYTTFLIPPKKSGFEVCQEIKADPALAAVRILMLTAKGRDTEVAKGLALGADAYMTKPFSTKELVEKVRSMLGD